MKSEVLPLTRLRLLGFLPLTFFLAHLSHHTSAGTPQHILWLCNLSNLVMASGLFFQKPMLVRIAVIWLIPGVPLWILDMMRTGDNPLSTFLSHLGGVSVGLIAVYRVRAHRFTWLYAWLYGFSIQMLCRLITPSELNVNLAFAIYEGYEFFPRYWQYWLFTAVQAALGLWILGLCLMKLFPPAAVKTPSGLSDRASIPADISHRAYGGQGSPPYSM